MTRPGGGPKVGLPQKKKKQMEKRQLGLTTQKYGALTQGRTKKKQLSRKKNGQRQKEREMPRGWRVEGQKKLGGVDWVVKKGGGQHKAEKKKKKKEILGRKINMVMT